MSDSIYQLWLYNDWANKLLLNTMKLDGDTVPPSCLRLFSHIVNAQMTWLYRINGERSPVGIWDEHVLSVCEKYHTLSSEALHKKVEDYKYSELEPVRYTNTKGESFENSLQDILMHIFNHGTYHRAQIATEMRKNGLEPVNTDYITFVRKHDKHI